jgi:hypothetical protein
MSDTLKKIWQEWRPFMSDSVNQFKDNVKKVNLEQWIIEKYGPDLSTTQLDHTINGLKAMINELAGIKGSAGGFIKAVLMNDLRGAVQAADDVNIGMLHIYVRFIHDFVPIELLMLSAPKIHKEGGNILSKCLSTADLHELVNSTGIKIEDMDRPDIIHLRHCESCKENYMEMRSFYEDIMRGKHEEDDKSSD